MNHLTYDFLSFVHSTLEYWQKDFKDNPEVWIGFFKPQHKLTKKQHWIAEISVTVAKVIVEHILDETDAEDNSYKHDTLDEWENDDDYLEDDDEDEEEDNDDDAEDDDAEDDEGLIMGKVHNEEDDE